MNKSWGTMDERFRAVLGVLVVVEKDGKVLMLRRQGKFDAGTYSLPGGCMEDSETVLNAAAREALEEVDININLDKSEVVSVLHRICPWGWQANEFIVLTKDFNGIPKIMEEDKADDLQWFEVNNLPENISKYAKRAIDNYINRETFSEINY